MQRPDNYLPNVRQQYEALPYPARDPQDENKRLVLSWLDDLPMINHYCFAGKQSFRNNFRALVAGGGTGDATIFLAQQLRHTNAEVVHLDLSEASTAIARERATVRGLTNIVWIRDSLLNLASLDVGQFDYINCSGVLHHLADPDLGFRALQGVLAPHGAIGLMVYGTTGRTGVYQMQSLLRMVNDGEHDMPRKISNARDLLESLPPSTWFKRADDLHSDHRTGDSGIFDLLLHSKDRSYSVAELFDWLGGPADQATGHGMHLEFSDVQRGRAPYLPHMVLGHKPPAMMQTLRAMPRRQQYAMAELMVGNLITHSLYATHSPDCTAPYGDPNYVPQYFHEPVNPDALANIFSASRGQPFQLQHQHSGATMMVNPGRYAAQILRLIDGQRSFADIFAQFRADWRGKAAPPDDATLFADFAEVYHTLNALERILLRHRLVVAS